MPLTDRELLRELLADTADTDEEREFTDTELDDLLERSSQDTERAALEGWKILAARYAQWAVDVTEGNSSRKMSQLLEHATEMIRLYSRASAGPTEGRARVGRIRRRSDSS